MLHSTILYISLRYICGQMGNIFYRLISNLSTIGISIGVMSLTVVTAITNGFESLLQKNILEYIPHVILTTHYGNLNPNKYPVKNISHLQGIDRVDSIVKSDIILQSQLNIGLAIMIGININSSDPLLNYLEYINPEVLNTGSYNVILGIKLAEQLGVNKGDKLRLIVPGVNKFTPIGRIPNQRLFTVVGTFNTNGDTDSNTLLVNQEDAARLMDYPLGNITGWRLYLKKPLNIDQLSQQTLPTDIIWKDWREQKGEFFQAVKMENNMMKLLLSLIIIVAEFNIAISLSLLVMEKQSEVAILQTLGLNRFRIMIIFMLQGIFIGIIGSFIGVLLGLFIAKHINIIMKILGLLDNNIELPIYIDFIHVILIYISTVGISLLATLYPSWRAATIQPAEILRYE
ncbi:lipoprotein-releasing ABC transporter permease subunit LolC [Arsenophonus endosymbiont of Lipoptena cervi]|uniref:lipoprotein-releasing ABC transporter permease subunit LolC n=1 Tax=Arsenophonus endosymbiont of Lipoptena cervi TaxID=363258 RepID=UPI00376F2796